MRSEAPDSRSPGPSAFARCWLNAPAAVAAARSPAYPDRAAGGHPVVTPGNETDFAATAADVLALCHRFRVASLGYDPWQSTQMAQRLRAERVNMSEFRATTQNFSPAILELDAGLRAGRLRHDGDPVLEWCVGNVVNRPDRRGNLYPAKQRPEQKIDAAVALMMAVGRCQAAEAEDASDGPSFFSRRLFA
ncbi:MAG: hypothetical protein ICV73_17895 [Acetobacteraceae bacterium]|nr:hypothetical protein [Acetobacteraceae bacterium]